MNLSLLLIPAALAAGVSFALAPLASRLARRVGAMDQPGPRKLHGRPVPRLGGLAVVGAIVLVGGANYWIRWTSGLTLPTRFSLGIALGLVPVLGVSIWDDIRPLRAREKFIAHLLGAVIAVGFGISLAREVHLFGATIPLGLFAFPLSVVWMVGLTNAFNIVDGLDGLSAGLGLISSISLGGVFLLVGQPNMAAAVLVVAGALAGFLPYNLHPARMFLGDTGATAVGFCLAALAVSGGSTLSAGFAVLLPVFVLGLPIAETLISMARRFLKRLDEKSAGGVFEADRNHLHHRLLALGINHQRAVFILYGVGLLLACGAFISMFMTTLEAALFALALLMAGFIGVARLEYEEFAVLRNGAALHLYEAPVVKRSMFVVFVDLLIVALAVYGAVALKTDDWRLATFRTTAFSMVAVLAPITVVVFWRLNIYRGSWRLADAKDFVRACGAVALAALAGLAVHLVMAPDATPSLVSLFGIYALVALMLVTGSRASYQVLMALRRTKQPGTRALIYGAGRKGARAFRELTSDVNAALYPVAFLDDDPALAGKLVNGAPVAGSVRAIETAVRRFAARAVIVSSDKIAGPRLADVRARCERLGVTLLRIQINVEQFAADLARPAAAAELVPAAAGPAVADTSRVPVALAVITQLEKVFDSLPTRFQTVATPFEVGSPLRSAWPEAANQPCQACGAMALNRSHTRTGPERLRRKLTQKRPYRCQECGWRGWRDTATMPLVQRPIARSPAPTWASTDVILKGAIRPLLRSR